jgi:hypothetical protein
MAKIGQLTQLALENFAELIKDAEENGAGLEPLSAAEVRERNLAARQALHEKLEGDELPTWAETYHRMLQSGFTKSWRIAAYIAWATMPKEFRWPKTQNELAREVLGLTSDRAIATWRKNYYPAIDQMIADLQAQDLLEWRPGAFRATGLVVSDPSYRATPERRLFYEMTGDYTPKLKTSRETPGKSDLSEFSDAELAAMSGEDAKEFLRKLRDEEEILPETDEEENAED